MSIAVAVLGASGYAGGELVRLLDAHPRFEVVHLGAHARAGERLADVQPHLPGGERTLGGIAAESLPGLRAAFLALPHGRSWKIGLQLAEAGIAVFDLGSDFRMDHPQRYRRAYGEPHPAPAELGEWIYGLPELFGGDLPGASRVAVPGCYPTGALLALAPLAAAGAIAGPIVVDAMSGATGAGRAVRADLAFGAVAEGVKAYGVASHRHRPEIEMGLEKAAAGAPKVQFTPHLVPMQRGLLSTCSAALTGDGDAQRILSEAYADCPFAEVIDRQPETRWVVGSNRALIRAVPDEDCGRVIVTSAIDNLVKGAAGQAVQCANLAFGLPETAGLTAAGWLP